MLHAHGSKLGYDEVEASGELCQAAKDSNLSMLQLLLDCDCSANAADYDQRTCLHLASASPRLRTAIVGSLPHSLLSLAA